MLPKSSHTQIIPGELRYVRDYIAANHEFAASDKAFHQVELMFVCRYRRLRKNARRELDVRQVGTEWLPLAALTTARLYPLDPQKVNFPHRPSQRPHLPGDVN